MSHQQNNPEDPWAWLDDDEEEMTEHDIRVSTFYLWSSIQSYLDWDGADLEYVSHIYKFEPDLVTNHPRWAEFSKHQDWQELTSKPPIYSYLSDDGHPDAYYVARLVKNKDMYGLYEVLRGWRKQPLPEAESQWVDIMLGMDERHLNHYLAECCCSDSFLRKLAEKPEKATRIRVARNPHTAPDLLILLCKDKDQSVAKAASDNPNFPHEGLETFTDIENERISSKLEKLELLDWTELGEFLLNPDFPAEGLQLLAQRNIFIRFACVMHPNAPESLWRQQLQADEVWMRAAVALNPSVPVEVIESMAELEDSDIAFAAGCNWKLSEATQIRLANHSERWVRLNVADHSLANSVWKAVAEQQLPYEPDIPLEKVLSMVLNPKANAKKLQSAHSVYYRSKSRGESLSTCISHAVAMHPNFPVESMAEYRYYLPWVEKENKNLAIQMLEGRVMPPAQAYEDGQLEPGEYYKLPAHVVNHGLRSNNAHLQRRGVSHPGCDRALLIPLLFSPDTNLLKKMAERTDMPRFFYELLWAVGRKPVQKVLQENKACTQRGTSFAKKSKMQKSQK